MTRHAADPGSTLADRFAHPAPMTPVDVAAVGAQVAAELDTWHRGGTSHRALAPGSVELGTAPDGRLLARLRPPTTSAPPATGVRSGSAVPAHAAADDDDAGGADRRYRAPEQLSGRPVGPAADVYALGVVLLDGLVGPQEVPRVPDDLGAAWRYLLAGMIAASPADRPTAATVAHTLAGVPGVALPGAGVPGVGDAGGGAGGPGAATPEPDTAPRSKLLPGGAHVEPVSIDLPRRGRLGRLRPPVPGRRRPPEPDTRPHP